MSPNDRQRFPGAQSSRSDCLPPINYKNRLQEHCQKNKLGLPFYNTFNEGAQYDPKFKSIVRVRNKPAFVSSRTFTQKKKAEQDAARVALEHICAVPKLKVDEYPYPLVPEDAPFCKSILNQFALDMHLDIPIYKTNQVERSLEHPVFVSSVHLNGFNFTGAKAKNKKEAEQLAARIMVLFFLERGDSQSVSVISAVIESKFHIFAAVGNTKDTNSVFSKAWSILNTKETTDNVNITETSTNQSADSLPDDIIQKQDANPLLHPCKKARLESPTQVTAPATEFVPSESEQNLAPPPSESDQEKADVVSPTDIVNSTDTSTNQLLNSVPDNMVQKQTADPHLHPCKMSRLDNSTQVAAPDAEFVPSESEQTLGPPPSESDHEKADAVSPTGIVNLMDTSTNQLPHSLPDNIFQKQAVDPLLHPCKMSRLESPTQVATPATEFVPSEFEQPLVPPPSESDHEKADAVSSSDIVNSTDTSTNQSPNSLPDNIVQKQAANQLPDPCKISSLESSTQVPASATEFVPSEFEQPLVPPPSESDHEKADAVSPTDIVNSTDTSTNQSPNSLPDNIVQKQAANLLPDPCKMSSLESPTQVSAHATEFVPSESEQTSVPPPSESDNEKADAVVALTDVTPSVAL